MQFTRRTGFGRGGDRPLSGAFVTTPAGDADSPPVPFQTGKGLCMNKITASAAQALATGVFDGYASVFGVPDLARDVVVAGAFQDSLAMRGGAAGIRLLWQHDPREPVGIFTHVFEDKRGLYVRGALNLSVLRGRELFALLQQGAVAGLSIGYKPLRARREAQTGYRQLLHVDLWEVSLVTFPLLPAARVLRVAGSPAQGQGAAAR